MSPWHLVLKAQTLVVIATLVFVSMARQRPGR